MAVVNAGLGSISPVASGGDAHVSDTTGAYVTGNLHSFQNNGAEKASVNFEGTFTGHDGIFGGKVTIAETLAVTGASTLSNNLTIASDFELRFGDSGTRIIGSSATDFFRFDTGGTERFRINDTTTTNAMAFTSTGLITATAGVTIGNAADLTLTGVGAQILMSGGADATVPGIATSGDPDTGMYSVGTNILGFATGGSVRMILSSSGLALGTATLSNGAANRLDLASGDSFNIVSGDLTVGGAATVTGNLTVSGTGLAVGSGASADSPMHFGGSFAGNTLVRGILADWTLTVPVGGDAYGIHLIPTLVEAASGTHTNFVSLYLSPPTITAGGAAVTNATTLQVTGAPNAIGATNRAFWVENGLSEVQALTVSSVLISTGLLTTTAGIVSGSDIISDTNSTDDLGSTGVRWANLFVDAVTVTNTMAIAGDLISSAGTITFAEITTPTALANHGRIYAKADNKMYFQDGAGTEHEVAFV